MPAPRGLWIRRKRRALGVQFLEGAVQRLELRRELRIDRQLEPLRGPLALPAISA
jgi:hypothetical protein